MRLCFRFQAHLEHERKQQSCIASVVSRAPPYTIIVPARNEEGTIERTIRSFGAPCPSDWREIIVVCNGCSDRTAQRALAADSNARVIELREGGKWRAINCGLRYRRHAIALIVDADVSISRDSLDALASALTDSAVEAVSPSVQFDTAHVSSVVRAYYRVFATLPYLRDMVGGSGVYGLSPAGVSRLGELPPIMSDDGLIRTLIPPERQRRVFQTASGETVIARVRPPTTACALLRTEARWRRGDRELRSLGHPPEKINRGYWRSKAAWTGCRKFDLFVYVALKVVGRVLASVEPLQANRGWRHNIGGSHTR